MNYWILQCNIDHYDWFEFIKYIKRNNKTLDTWVINPRMHKNLIPNIQESDIAFVWLTKFQLQEKDTRGIWAMGKIVKLLSNNIKDFDYVERFWRHTRCIECQRALFTFT
jgi:hypothetical protein